MQIGVNLVAATQGIEFKNETERDLSVFQAKERPEAQEEVTGTRLSNFLSDDAAPEGRDLSLEMNQPQVLLPETEEVSDEVVEELEELQAPLATDATDTSIPSPMRSDTQIVTGSPVESAIKSLLEKSAEPVDAPELEPTYEGKTAGAYAVEMYVGVQDMLTEIAA